MIRILLLTATAVLTALTAAAGVNNTVGAAIPTALGHVRSQTVGASDVAYFGFDLRPDRSYAGFCWLASIENGALVTGWCHVSLRDFSDVLLTSGFQSPEGMPRSGEAVSYALTRGGVQLCVRPGAEFHRFTPDDQFRAVRYDARLPVVFHLAGEWV